MTDGERSIEAFLSAVASEEVTPAGGTAAAVGGATGAALCAMGCLHTVGAEGANDSDAPDLPSIRDDLRWYRGRLIALADADADADAVAALLAAHPDGIGTEHRRATGVPLAVAEACSAVLAHAAVRATVFTVRHNADRLSDDAFADEVVRRSAAVERDADRAHERAVTAAASRR